MVAGRLSIGDYKRPATIGSGSRDYYPTIINSRKLQKFLDHGNLELYGNDYLYSFVKVAVKRFAGAP